MNENQMSNIYVLGEEETKRKNKGEIMGQHKYLEITFPQ